jgi:hypothetical protein
MFNDETQEDTTLENGVEEETHEEVDAEESADEPDWEAEAKKWKAIAERKAKKLEAPAPKQTTKKAETNGLTEDDILTITTIQDKDLINTAREIAKLKGITLAEAADSTMFRLAKAEREEAIRQEKVSMEASRGSGNRGKKKDFKTSGLSDAEHKELWRQRVSR